MRSKKRFFTSMILCQKEFTLPRATLDSLKAISAINQLPIGLLICRAIENELNSANPFAAQLDLPDVGPDDTSTSESQRLFSFIRANGGMNLDYLVMMRSQMSIETKEQLLAAYALLLVHGVIEEYYPEKAIFAYHPSYRVVRVVKIGNTISKPVSNLPKIKSTITKGVLDEID